MGKNKKNQKEKDIKLENLETGIKIYENHPLFSRMGWHGEIRSMDKNKLCSVNRYGTICLNKNRLLEPKQWAYVIAHCGLHLAFGHFDAENMPGYELTKENGKKEKIVDCDKRLWNQACDIYIAKFLADMKFGKPVTEGQETLLPGTSVEEAEIYEMLLEHRGELPDLGFADLEGLECPVDYSKGWPSRNEFAVMFAYALAESASEAVGVAGGHEGRKEIQNEAAQWFINHYPLLGGIASSFKIIMNYELCMQKEIHIAAVDTSAGEIYINPTAQLSREEERFVLAHEFLHAGLQHGDRCQGRDSYLWNVACDYVINGWLVEMQIGRMPEEGALYDEKLKNLSAEMIYDLILNDIKTYKKQYTFRGYGGGDIIRDKRGKKDTKAGISLDEFYKSALAQGLEYHQAEGRGWIPVGLIEEIKALSMPPIPWDVRLAQWFDSQFPAVEKRRTYTRPSRRQASTPDIIMPRYVADQIRGEGRTFGVVIDTSGSISVKLLGMALGSIASYAVAKEVAYVRVVFCDAAAYDAGYLSTEEMAGKVKVQGRGGTVIQAGVDLLEKAKDFPPDGPILIITDGCIENRLKIQREHAFLIPKGRSLPFRVKGKVFYFS